MNEYNQNQNTLETLQVILGNYVKGSSSWVDVLNQQLVILK